MLFIRIKSIIFLFKKFSLLFNFNFRTMKKFILLFFTFLYVGVNAQTWSDNVAQIVYDKCTKCHHPGGIAPTSLMTYNDASPMAAAIYDAVAQETMPPWPPENAYQQYVHSRVLTPTEKTTLMSWSLNGALEGNSSATPPPPVYTSSLILGNGDLTVQMPTYMSKATSGNDDYACFSVPSGLLENRVIKSVEIIPGNREIVHHALIYLDPNAVEVTDSSGGNCASPSNANTKLMAGYTPGSTPMTLPAVAPLKLGINIAAGSNVYFAMHYPAGSYGQFDSTKVIFHFYPIGTTGVRQVYAEPIIQNWTFGLPPNQITNVSAQYPGGSSGIPADLSMLSVFPHMHLLGQSIKAYAIKPNADTLKFANIPHWDFHWQDFYFFKNIQFAPQGTIFKGEGKYDNTSLNTHNPNNPPQMVTAGLNTSDEMFLVYFHFMLHQAGDENYDMEALMSASLQEQLQEDASPISVFPNPFENATTIAHPGVKAGDVVSVYLYDSQGKLLRKLVQSAVATQDQFSVNWDGNNDANAPVRKGVYFISIQVNGQNTTKQLIKN